MYIYICIYILYIYVFHGSRVCPNDHVQRHSYICMLSWYIYYIYTVAWFTGLSQRHRTHTRNTTSSRFSQAVHIVTDQYAWNSVAIVAIVPCAMTDTSLERYQCDAHTRDIWKACSHMFHIAQTGTRDSRGLLLGIISITTNNNTDYSHICAIYDISSCFHLVDQSTWFFVVC